MGSKKSMRILGANNARTKWERFNRVQKTAQILAGGVREPKGVHRFKTWEEINEWKIKYQVQGEYQTKANS